MFYDDENDIIVFVGLQFSYLKLNEIFIDFQTFLILR